MGLSQIFISTFINISYLWESVMCKNLQPWQLPLILGFAAHLNRAQRIGHADTSESVSVADPAPDGLALK